jgi:hypothetical protein
MNVHALSPVLAALSIAGAVAFVVIVAGSGAFGVWLAKRLTKRPGEPEVSIRENLRRGRAQLREELTSGERLFLYAYSLVAPLLAPAAILLLVFGASSTRGVGIGLLLVALVTMAVPISPVLRARVRRRDERANDRK